MPVLRNVQDMNYADIEKGIMGLGEKAKKGQLSIEDMDGGTFTISNGGVFGSLFGTPIINPPQSAILGMHGTFERPVVRNGQVKITKYEKLSQYFINDKKSPTKLDEASKIFLESKKSSKSSKHDQENHD